MTQPSTDAHSHSHDDADVHARVCHVPPPKGEKETLVCDCGAVADYVIRNVDSWVLLCAECVPDCASICIDCVRRKHELCRECVEQKSHQHPPL